MGSYITFPELLLWLPVVASLFCFFIKNEKTVKTVSLLFAVIFLGIAVWSLAYIGEDYTKYNVVNYFWLKYIGSSFYLSYTGVAPTLVLMSALVYFLLITGTWKNSYQNSGTFHGLLWLTLAGLVGVFIAKDALVFYFFWELALIPVYFLNSIWGGKKRVQATFKFFIYTFAGSLLMLVAIVYLYMQTGQRTYSDGTVAPHDFSWNAFVLTGRTLTSHVWVFWLMMLAFAIKIPLVPFHTWQPQAYNQATTPAVSVMSAIMVKMGLFGIMRWVLPVMPQFSKQEAHIILILCVIGILYASLIAMVQKNIKKFIGYSSIAHLALMAAALFTFSESGITGTSIQMFNHGINVLGFWLVAGIIEKNTGVKNIKDLSGLAQKAPWLTVFLLILAFANVALPITNAFVGEFFMFKALFDVNIWFAVTAGLSIILAAAYTLRMVQKIFYGSVSKSVTQATDVNAFQALALSAIVILIFVFGVYPQALIHISQQGVTQLINLIS